MRKDLERIRSLLEQEDYEAAIIIIDDLLHIFEEPEEDDANS